MESWALGARCVKQKWVNPMCAWKGAPWIKWWMFKPALLAWIRERANEHPKLAGPAPG
jgi:hypothetical protein